MVKDTCKDQRDKNNQVQSHIMIAKREKVGREIKWGQIIYHDQIFSARQM